MGLISKASWIGVGYVLGARAGTGRYDQIAAATRKLAARPEIQAYLKPLIDCLPGSNLAQRASGPPGSDPAPHSPTAPPPPLNLPSPGAPPLVTPPAGTSASGSAPGLAAARPVAATDTGTPTPAAVPGRARTTSRQATQ